MRVVTMIETLRNVDDLSTRFEFVLWGQHFLLYIPMYQLTITMNLFFPVLSVRALIQAAEGEIPSEFLHHPRRHLRGGVRVVLIVNKIDLLPKDVRFGGVAFDVCECSLRFGGRLMKMSSAH